MGKGISLCIPDDDNFYNVELRPFDVKFVVFRQSYQVMKESLKLGYNSVLGDDTIVATVQSSGKRKQLSRDNSIYSKLFKHKNGYVITYKNRS